MVFNAQQINRKFVEETIKKLVEGFIEFLEKVNTSSGLKHISTVNKKASVNNDIPGTVILIFTYSRPKQKLTDC